MGHGARNFRHSAGFLQNSLSRGQVGCSVGGPGFENVGGPGSITEEGPGSVYGRFHPGRELTAIELENF